jgi:hypothetical protein
MPKSVTAAAVGRDHKTVADNIYLIHTPAFIYDTKNNYPVDVIAA